MNKTKLILKENILRNGTMTLYHGSNDLILWGSIDKGKTKFEPLHGVGGVHGPGLYTVLEKDINSSTFRGMYGKYVIKIFSRITNKFLIADYDIYKIIYGENQNYLKDQCDKLNLDYSGHNFTYDSNQDGIGLAYRNHKILDGVIYVDNYGKKIEKHCVLYNSNNFKIAGFYEIDPDPKKGVGELRKEIDKVRLCDYKTVIKFLSEVESESNNPDNVPGNFLKVVQKLAKLKNEYSSFKEHCYKQFIEKYFKSRSDFYKILVFSLSSNKISSDTIRKNPFIIDMKLLPKIKEDSDDLFFSHNLAELSYIFYNYKYYQFCKELVDAGILKVIQFGDYMIRYGLYSTLPETFEELVKKSLVRIDVSIFNKLDKKIRLEIIKNKCAVDNSGELNKLIPSIGNKDENLLELITDISYVPGSFSQLTFENFKLLFSFVCQNIEFKSMIEVLINFFNSDSQRRKICRAYIVKVLQENEYKNCQTVVEILNSNTDINITLTRPEVSRNSIEPVKTSTEALLERRRISILVKL